MIWQENVIKIVMVTQLEEEGKKKCDQYWPQTINKPLIVGNFVLTMEVEKEHSVYLYRKINVKHKLEKQERRVHHFHFIQWPDHGVPDSIKLVDFYRAVTNISCNQPGPLLVHYSAGIGRTGTFIAIDSLYQHGKLVGYIDVKEYVQIMRKDRMNMIQTFEQYEAVFETLQELFTVPNTSIQVNDFCSYVQEQENTKVPQNQKTYRLEFQRLQSLRPSYSSEHFTSSRLDVNKSKNAVNSILPRECIEYHDDYFRSYLMSFGKNKSNNINAVIIPVGECLLVLIYHELCIPGYSVHGNFLVTQCPLKETVVDFWTMVLDFLMYSHIKVQDAPLWSNTDKTLQFEKFDIELDYDKTPREVQLAIVHRAYHRLTKPPTCILYAKEKMKIDDQVDVFQVIRTIQLRRSEFVTNFDQYEYCYKCIKDFIEGQSSQTSRKLKRIEDPKLQKIVPNKKVWLSYLMNIHIMTNAVFTCKSQTLCGDVYTSILLPYVQHCSGGEQDPVSFQIVNHYWKACMSLWTALEPFLVCNSEFTCVLSALDKAG
ncbi:hypothetical protein AM593_10592, partial [Mytilus galloprovincialis]